MVMEIFPGGSLGAELKLCGQLPQLVRTLKAHKSSLPAARSGAVTCRGSGVGPRSPTNPNSKLESTSVTTRSDSALCCLEQHLPPLNAAKRRLVTIEQCLVSQCRAALSQGWLRKPNGASPRPGHNTCQQHEQHANTDPYRDKHQLRAECPQKKAVRETHKPSTHSPPSPTLHRRDDDAAGSPHRYSSSSASRQAPSSAP